MSAKLKKLLKDLQAATCPEDVFGDLKDGSIKESYRKWCKDTHEDRCGGDEKHFAHEAFLLIQKFAEEAEAKINNKTYGDKTAPSSEASIFTKKGEYKLGNLLFSGDVCDIYKGSLNKNPVLLKIPRQAANNDFLKNEAQQIFAIRDFYIAKPLKILAHIPDIIETTEIPEGKSVRRINIFQYPENFISLQEILDAYPKGIDPRDMAWMFNRIMAALLAAHQAKVIHGAITPEHILLNVKEHNGLLVDWKYSVKEGGIIKAICPKYRDYYPKDVFEKKPAKYGVDLYMLAKCMLALLGGNWKNVPNGIKGLLAACLLGYAKRSQDIWEQYEEFGKILKVLYGPRKFRTFVMPD